MTFRPRVSREVKLRLALDLMEHQRDTARAERDALVEVLRLRQSSVEPVHARAGIPEQEHGGGDHLDKTRREVLRLRDDARGVALELNELRRRLGESGDWQERRIAMRRAEVERRGGEIREERRGGDRRVGLASKLGDLSALAAAKGAL